MGRSSCMHHRRSLTDMCSRGVKLRLCALHCERRNDGSKGLFSSAGPLRYRQNDNSIELIVPFKNSNPNMTHRISLSFVLTLAVLHTSAADMNARLPKPPAREVDFATDIKPILERSCAQCHSGEKPKGKFSIETRDGILKGGDSKDAAVIPGQSGSSPLGHMVKDLVPEMEMPPVGKRKKFAALTDAEVGVVRAWIDQGAKWPDGLKLTIATAEEPPKGGTTYAGAEAAPVHDAIFDMIRLGDRRGIAKALKNSGAVNLRDEEGNTPLIQAAFYLDAAAVREFVERGADVNATNNAGVSALMKAVWDLDKTGLLIQRGANVNAASTMGNTPLIIASFAYGSSEVVKSLIAAGAKVDAVNGAGGNAVVAAAESGDLKTLRA